MPWQRVCDGVVFWWQPFQVQFNVMNTCDEQNKLKNGYGDPTHTLLVYCLYHGRVVAHENDVASYPFICPERYSEEDREHLFPIDMLCAMSSIEMDGPRRMLCFPIFHQCLLFRLHLCRLWWLDVEGNVWLLCHSIDGEVLTTSEGLAWQLCLSEYMWNSAFSIE